MMPECQKPSAEGQEGMLCFTSSHKWGEASHWGRGAAVILASLLLATL